MRPLLQRAVEQCVPILAFKANGRNNADSMTAVFRPLCNLRLLFAALFATLLVHAPATAEPADIDAASRGVVRVIVIENDDGETYPISHGTGFAITPERIVTNAHVIAEARADSALSIAIVPSDGGRIVYGKIVAYSDRNDLALLATTSKMNLPPLTIAGTGDPDSGTVVSVGYPMNVDRAQGLGADDIIRPQPPVKSRGYLSGSRPSRDFDTVLHTAPIGRGSSGGPLLDNCGRVIGVNSFGTEGGSADSEFYFAVSIRELLPFLRDNAIVPQVNSLPCRSIAELDQQERVRMEREQLLAVQEREAKAARDAKRAAELRNITQFEIIAERENAMMLTVLLILCALGGAAVTRHERERGEDGPMKVAAVATGLAVLVAALTWLGRPAFNEIEDRVAARLAEEARAEQGKAGGKTTAEEPGRYICVVNTDRSRITTTATQDIPFAWSDDGCVNSRTQYGLMNGRWSRIFVPNDEASVSVNSFDPGAGEYRVERYLLGHQAMEAVRKARGEYKPPECGKGPTEASTLGSNQSAIFNLLPSQPNERLIYDCHPAK